jgi:hypothetical protein
VFPDGFQSMETRVADGFELGLAAILINKPPAA